MSIEALRAEVEKLRVLVEARRALDDWFEDIVAGLMINGVAMDEIQLQHFPHQSRYVVVVRDVPRYEFKLNWLT